MTPEEFLRRARAHAPDLPDASTMAAVRFCDPSEGRREDPNEARREEVAELLLEDFSIDDRPIIRALIEAERAMCERHSTSSDTIYALCDMLCSFRRVEDVALLARVKFATSFDLRIGSFLDMIFGVELEESLAYYRSPANSDPWLVELLEAEHPHLDQPFEAYLAARMAYHRGEG